MIAAQGNIDMQALEIKSANGVIQVVSAKRVYISTAGGAYIDICDDKIDLGGPGKITVQAGHKKMEGPAKMNPDGRSCLTLVKGKPQEVIKPEERPGLKVHVCTIVAPDTKAGEAWVETYVHAKLMIIDDTFMTLGSANINTRSMESDSELNIAHHRPEISQPARKSLWDQHTGNALRSRIADMSLVTLIRLGIS